jgi:hypothetical protein
MNTPKEPLRTRSIVQVEFSSSILRARREILADFGRPVFSLLGADAFAKFDLTSRSVGIVIIGHGATQSIRKELIRHVRSVLPDVPVIALLRRDEQPIESATQNLRADDPLAWVKQISAAINGIQ